MQNAASMARVLQRHSEIEQGKPVNDAIVTNLFVLATMTRADGRNSGKRRFEQLEHDHPISNSLDHNHIRALLNVQYSPDVLT